MEDFIKRINLSFDIRREQDRQAYEILSSEQHKTTYIIDLILSSEKEVRDLLDRDILKECLRDVLGEMNLCTKTNFPIIQEDIPEEIFDIFEKI